ncbi:MAG TPA: helix-turn-helix transcriptional regulator [Solirubrobacteraceae bacterium]|jgi:DNA-binding PadR family transcriptional regulator|nr:helix-turn-helix transcriptional regulator [Solirubrobacteraceae bacterium]
MAYHRISVQDAVLSVVVEQVSYGYQIARRLEEQWSTAVVYRAVGRLLARELIERTSSGGEPADSRRKYLRATPAGVQLNATRIAAALDARHETVLGLLGTPATSLIAAIGIVEQRLTAEHGDAGPGGGEAAEFAALERRFVSEARLKWIRVVRRRLRTGQSQLGLFADAPLVNGVA